MNSMINHSENYFGIIFYEDFFFYKICIFLLLLIKKVAMNYT